MWGRRYGCVNPQPEAKRAKNGPIAFPPQRGISSLMETGFVLRVVENYSLIYFMGWQQLEVVS